MSLILTDLSNTTFYTFPSGFDLHTWDDHDFATRSKLLERFGRHGGVEVGDGAIEPRTVTVKGAHHAASQAALKTFLNDLKEALHYNGEAYRFSWESGYYIGVAQVKKFKSERHSGGLAYKSVDIEIQFECPDPFWYSTTNDNTGSVTVNTSPKSITLTNNSNVPSPLTITRYPNAACGDFTIENATDDDQLCRYADPTLGNGHALIIDSNAGTVKRSGLNTIRYFTGAFLRSLPGNNAIIYTGPTGGTIWISAPRRFL